MLHRSPDPDHLGTMGLDTIAVTLARAGEQDEGAHHCDLLKIVCRRGVRV
jgi:hypothetical protein